MTIDIQLLSRICEAPGAPGYEKRIRELVLKKLDGLADEVGTDNMGNVIALKKGRSSKKKAMAAAHMDEIGLRHRCYVCHTSSPSKRSNKAFALARICFGLRLR